ncbi:MAG TPA: enoyl-CoA hydratase-related protein [Marmoricola sp.]|jgi:enoyl-CoA hydratase/carnithine racemase|nr:enoyl-CoA hydratase-related protein [Marmoricola sp.]
MTSLVRSEDVGAVRVITLNRPEVRNAIDVPLRVALAEALEAAAADPAVRCIVLTGAGGSFCSGGDISSMTRQSREETVPRAEAAARVVRAIWGTPKPVLAAVEGSAFGAGTALALACDRVVTASDAVFSTSFTAVGLAGDMGIFASLPARIGAARAKQLMMLPRRLSGAEAGELGLADAVVSPGTALSSALSDAERLAAGPPLALGAIKTMLAGPRSPYDVLDLEVQTQADLFDTDDFAEGVAAFHEKRPPVFRGSADPIPGAPADRAPAG